MSDYASLKKSKAPRTLSVLLALLILLEICSLGVLASRMASYSAAPKSNQIISLTSGAGVRTGRRNADGSISWNEGSRRNGMQLAAIGLLPASASPKVVFKDDDQVWGTSTEINIFKIAYDETGEVTVQTANGDKLIAPGTANDYSFTIVNNESKALKYTVNVEAYVEGTDEKLPVVAKMYNGNGKYLSGSASDWADVLELDGKSDTGSLAGGRSLNYYLSWQWPFERTDGAGLDANDAFDTMLGNLTVDEPITLTIVINTIAEIDDDVPYTGDDSAILPWAIAAGGALVLICVLLVLKKKERKEEDREN